MIAGYHGAAHDRKIVVEPADFLYDEPVFLYLTVKIVFRYPVCDFRLNSCRELFSRVVDFRVIKRLCRRIVFHITVKPSVFFVFFYFFQNVKSVLRSFHKRRSFQGEIIFPFSKFRRSSECLLSLPLFRIRRVCRDSCRRDCRAGALRVCIS